MTVICHTMLICHSMRCLCDLMCVLTANNVKFNDLLQFDPATMTWVDLTSSIRGTPPAPRDCHGFAALDGKVYIYGGNSSTSIYGTATGSSLPPI